MSTAVDRWLAVVEVGTSMKVVRLAYQAPQGAFAYPIGKRRASSQLRGT